MIQTISTRLEHQSPWRTLLMGLTIVLFLTVPDFLTGPEIAFSFFYILPVALVAWASDMRFAAVVGVVAAIAWIATDIASGTEFSHPLIPIWNTLTRLAVYMLVAALLARMHSAFQIARDLSRTDYLTGVANSRAFWQIAEDELARAQRYRRPFTIAYIDLDNFKTINDTLGHSVGDDVLRGVATALRQNTRRSDIIARLGGDEFAMLLPETDENDAKAVLTSLSERVTTILASERLMVTFSIGAVTFLDAPGDLDEMIKMAVTLMYDANMDGKNCVRHRVVETLIFPESRWPASGCADALDGLRIG